MVKGPAGVLIQDGECLRPALLSNHLHPEDIHEDMRLNASTDDVDEIACARLESSGDISFIKKQNHGSRG